MAARRKRIARCIEQTQGWMHFLCCMKAYLEHGINLRKSGSSRKGTSSPPFRPPMGSTPDKQGCGS